MTADVPYPAPRRAVWEITWRGAGDRRRSRPAELRPDEALSAAAQIGALGVRWVTIEGDELLQRPDWGEIAAALRGAGCGVEVATRGSLLSGQVAERLVALGVSGVTVEVNGLRGSRGGEWPRSPQASLAQIFQGATHARSRGIPITAITRVHRGNIDQLTALQGRLKAEGFSRWVVQLAHSGSGSPDDSLAMLPRRRLPELATVLARLSGDPDLPPIVHSTIGYLSREEPILRTSGRLDPQTFWRGAPCGRSTLGVAPDGGIKGCSNQRGAPFEVGNLRDEPLRAIWQDRARWFWVDPAPALAGGSCADCALKADCGGGCPCVAHAVTGRIFDNPYCVRAVRRAK